MVHIYPTSEAYIQLLQSLPPHLFLFSPPSPPFLCRIRRLLLPMLLFYPMLFQDDAEPIPLLLFLAFSRSFLDVPGGRSYYCIGAYTDISSLELQHGFIPIPLSSFQPHLR